MNSIFEVGISVPHFSRAFWVSFVYDNLIILASYFKKKWQSLWYRFLFWFHFVFTRQFKCDYFPWPTYKDYWRRSQPRQWPVTSVSYLCLTNYIWSRRLGKTTFIKLSCAIHWYNWIEPFINPGEESNRSSTPEKNLCHSVNLF